MNYTVVIIDADNQHRDYYFEKYENAKSFINSLLLYRSVINYTNYSDLQIIMFDKDGYIINE